MAVNYRWTLQNLLSLWQVFFEDIPPPAKLINTQMHELDQDFEPGVKCHALVALCKLFYADLRNCAGITAQPAATRILNAIVSACSMVVGSPAQAESDGVPLVAVENMRVDLCKQDPCGSRCSRISNREAINAQQLARVTDLHRLARGLKMEGSISACADAEKRLACTHAIPHLSTSSSARALSCSEMSTNLVVSIQQLSLARDGKLPTQVALQRMYEKAIGQIGGGYKSFELCDASHGCFEGTVNADI